MKKKSKVSKEFIVIVSVLIVIGSIVLVFLYRNYKLYDDQYKEANCNLESEGLKYASCIDD